jgi:nitroreductase
MNVLECILERRSIRSYLDREVPDRALDKILEAARWAPSASNRQPWEFVVIRDKETLQKIADLARYGSFISQAPFAVAVVTDPSTKWHIIDGSTAVQNMALAAWEMGIGTCWIGSLEREKASKVLGIPEERHLLTVLPFGYPAKTGHSTRTELKSLVHAERW